MTVRAIAAFPAERVVRLVEQPEPRIERDTDVLVEILDVGVCGTDREIAREGYGAPPAGARHLVLGHESLGRVLDAGPSAARLARGDLVVTTVRRPCPHPDCPACAVGRQDFCLTGDFTERGIKGRHGFMTERIVLGAGPVGLLGALALLVRGYETWVYSREPEAHPKARWVESVGARYLAAARWPFPAVAERLGNVDLVCEATGAATVAFHALAALGVNGVFVFTGVPGRKAPIELDASRLMRELVLRNQLVFGTVNAGPHAFEAAIDDLARFHARWPAALRALITGRSRPEAAPVLLARPPAGMKAVVAFADAA